MTGPGSGEEDHDDELFLAWPLSASRKVIIEQEEVGSTIIFQSFHIAAVGIADNQPDD
jgi:hypothetical protein